MVNTYAPNVNALNFIKQKLLDIKGQIGTKTIIVGQPPKPHSPNRQVNQTRAKQNKAQKSMNEFQR